MAKKGKMKKACEKYRMSGHKQENKKLRRERHKKRLEKFAKRKECGKTYEYKKNPYKRGTDEYVIEKESRKEKHINSGTKTEVQRFVSTMKMLDNWIKKEDEKLKDRKEKIKNDKKERK